MAPILVFLAAILTTFAISPNRYRSAESLEMETVNYLTNETTKATVYVDYINHTQNINRNDISVSGETELQNIKDLTPGTTTGGRNSSESLLLANITGNETLPDEKTNFKSHRLDIQSGNLIPVNASLRIIDKIKITEDAPTSRNISAITMHLNRNKNVNNTFLNHHNGTLYHTFPKPNHVIHHVANDAILEKRITLHTAKNGNYVVHNTSVINDIMNNLKVNKKKGNRSSYHIDKMTTKLVSAHNSSLQLFDVDTVDRFLDNGTDYISGEMNNVTPKSLPKKEEVQLERPGKVDNIHFESQKKTLRTSSESELKSRVYSNDISNASQAAEQNSFMNHNQISATSLLKLNSTEKQNLSRREKFYVLEESHNRRKIINIHMENFKMGTATPKSITFDPSNSSVVTKVTTAVSPTDGTVMTAPNHLTTDNEIPTNDIEISTYSSLGDHLEITISTGRSYYSQTNDDVTNNFTPIDAVNADVKMDGSTPTSTTSSKTFESQILKGSASAFASNIQSNGFLQSTSETVNLTYQINDVPTAIQKGSIIGDMFAPTKLFKLYIPRACDNCSIELSNEVNRNNASGTLSNREGIIYGFVNKNGNVTTKNTSGVAEIEHDRSFSSILQHEEGLTIGSAMRTEDIEGINFDKNHTRKYVTVSYGVSSTGADRNDGATLDASVDYDSGNETYVNGSANAKVYRGFSWPVKKEAIVEGDIVLGALMMVHEREDSYTCGPIMPQGGVQALEAMLYTLDQVNNSPTPLLPNITIGAHILDDCDKDTYGLEMAVDFIKGRKMSQPRELQLTAARTAAYNQDPKLNELFGEDSDKEGGSFPPTPGKFLDVVGDYLQKITPTLKVICSVPLDKLGMVVPRPIPVIITPRTDASASGKYQGRTGQVNVVVKRPRIPAKGHTKRRHRMACEK